MKKIKHFYVEDKLNKGYSDHSHGDISNSQTETVTERSKINTIGSLHALSKHLPEVNILTEYENIMPGTFEKLLKMAEEEQKHQHTMEIGYIDMCRRVQRLGQLTSIFIIMFISYAVIELTKLSSIFYALLFAAIAFLGIFLTSKNISSFKHHHNNNGYKDKYHRSKDKDQNRNNNKFK